MAHEMNTGSTTGFVGDCECTGLDRSGHPISEICETSRTLILAINWAHISPGLNV